MSDIPGLVEALEPVAGVFQVMKINFYVDGSVASSFHGASRSQPFQLFANNYKLPIL